MPNTHSLHLVELISSDITHTGVGEDYCICVKKKSRMKLFLAPESCVKSDQLPCRLELKTTSLKIWRCGVRKTWEKHILLVKLSNIKMNVCYIAQLLRTLCTLKGRSLACPVSVTREQNILISNHISREGQTFLRS